MSGTDLPTHRDADIIRGKRSMLPIQNEFNKNQNSVGESHRFVISFTKRAFLSKPNSDSKSSSVFKHI